MPAMIGRILRGSVGGLALTAMAVQIAEGVSAGTFAPTRFFAFFTIQSNLLAAFVLLATAAWSRPAIHRLRGAVVVYLTVTFFVVIVLLSDAELQLAIPWVDVVLHKITPIAVVLDWLFAPPPSRVSARATATWLTFPAAWLALTLLRGAIDGWYPYPFLDPANGGYATVGLTCAIILVAMAGVCALTATAANALMRFQR